MWAAFCARDSSTGVGICKCSQVEHEIPSASGPRLLEVGVGEEALRGRHRHDGAGSVRDDSLGLEPIREGLHRFQGSGFRFQVSGLRVCGFGLVRDGAQVFGVVLRCRCWCCRCCRCCRCWCCRCGLIVIRVETYQDITCLEMAREIGREQGKREG